MPHADPTRSLRLRTSYTEYLHGGYDRIITEIKLGVREKNVFDLPSPHAEGLARDIDALDPFEFETDDGKYEAFMAWLQSQLDAGVLSLISRDNNPYVKRAYEKGIQNGNERLAMAGQFQVFPIEATFNAPIHLHELEYLYLRNYTLLENINGALATDISETLATGLSQGWDYDRMADELVDRVEKVGKHRARLLAHTEVVNTVNNATLRRYEDAGIEQVQTQVEFLTAEDDRVCETCRALSGEVYSIEEAYDVIPGQTHPGCRCTWAPVI